MNAAEFVQMIEEFCSRNPDSLLVLGYTTEDEPFPWSAMIERYAAPTLAHDSIHYAPVDSVSGVGNALNECVRSVIQRFEERRGQRD